MSNLPPRLAKILVSSVSENSSIKKNNYPILDKMLKSLLTVGLLVSVNSAQAEKLKKYQVRCEPIDSSFYVKEVKEINPSSKPKDSSFAIIDRDGTKVYDEEGNIDAAFSPTVKCAVTKK